MEYSGLRHPYDAEQLESLRRWLREKEDEIVRLNAEIGRLRKLLRDGLTSNIPEWKERVREALGEETE